MDPHLTMELARSSAKVWRYFFSIAGTFAFIVGVAASLYYWHKSDELGLINAVNAASAGGMFLLSYFIIRRLDKSLALGDDAMREAAYRRDLFEMQLEGMELQERRMEEALATLKRQHADERQLLLEIREEREAELKALGFVQGVQQGPEVMEYLNNPRMRLRALPQQGDSEERQDKAS